MDDERTCLGCGGPLLGRKHQKTCSNRCRQTLFRTMRQLTTIRAPKQTNQPANGGGRQRKTK